VAPAAVLDEAVTSTAARQQPHERDDPVVPVSHDILAFP
jgi:hypothetical protein